MSWLTSMVVVVNQAGVINMKKLLLLLIFISFNSFAEWVYIDKNQDSDTKVYVETDTIEVEDGIVYWWDLNNYTEPQQEGMISSAMSRGGDCKNNRFVNLEFQWFKGSMATGEMGGTFKPEQQWTSPKSGTIEEKVFNYVCNYVGNAKPKVESKVKGREDVFQCKVLAESLLWDDEPHSTKGQTKEFLFEKTSKTVKFHEGSPFYGSALNISEEKDSVLFEANSKSSKLIYFYPSQYSNHPNKGIFKYTSLGQDSGITGMFEMMLATCNPIEF